MITQLFLSKEAFDKSQDNDRWLQRNTVSGTYNRKCNLICYNLARLDETLYSLITHEVLHYVIENRIDPNYLMPIGQEELIIHNMQSLSHEKLPWWEGLPAPAFEYPQTTQMFNQVCVVGLSAFSLLLGVYLGLSWGDIGLVLLLQLVAITAYHAGKILGQWNRITKIQWDKET